MNLGKSTNLEKHVVKWTLNRQLAQSSLRCAHILALTCATWKFGGLCTHAHGSQHRRGSKTNMMHL